MEYFVVAAELGSFNRAAEALYTSQSNVSKVIATAEKELGFRLLQRTNKGISLTQEGEHVLHYAKSMLKNADMILSASRLKKEKNLKISNYQSNMISNLMTDFYNDNKPIQMDCREGTVEEITDHVQNGISEIGLVYIAERQMKAFKHIIGHKRLEFELCGRAEACIYVGENHPYYERDSIDFSELTELTYVSGINDYFAMEHHLEHISLGTLKSEGLKNVVLTNSDHLTINMLLKSDVCSLGIDFTCEKYKQYKIKSLNIINGEKCLAIGYVYRKNEILSPLGQSFIKAYTELLYQNGITLYRKNDIRQIL